MSTETSDTIHGYGLSRKEATAVITKAILDMREGGIEKAEAEVIIQAVDCQTRRFQLTLNTIKLQLQVTAAGADWGELLNNARQITESGYDDLD